MKRNKVTVTLKGPVTFSYNPGQVAIYSKGDKYNIQSVSTKEYILQLLKNKYIITSGKPSLKKYRAEIKILRTLHGFTIDDIAAMFNSGYSAVRNFLITEKIY